MEGGGGGGGGMKNFKSRTYKPGLLVQGVAFALRKTGLPIYSCIGSGFEESTPGPSCPVVMRKMPNNIPTLLKEQCVKTNFNFHHT